MVQDSSRLCSRPSSPLESPAGLRLATFRAVAFAGDMGARTNLGLVQPYLALEPGVEGRDARKELRDVPGRGRLRGSCRSHSGKRAYRPFTAGSSFTGASRPAGSQLPGLKRNTPVEAGVATDRICQDLATGRTDHRWGFEACLKPTNAFAANVSASRWLQVRRRFSGRNSQLALPAWSQLSITRRRLREKPEPTLRRDQTRSGAFILRRMAQSSARPSATISPRTRNSCSTRSVNRASPAIGQHAPAETGVSLAQSASRERAGRQAGSPTDGRSASRQAH